MSYVRQHFPVPCCFCDDVKACSARGRLLWFSHANVVALFALSRRRTVGAVLLGHHRLATSAVVHPRGINRHFRPNPPGLYKRIPRFSCFHSLTSHCLVFWRGGYYVWLWEELWGWGEGAPTALLTTTGNGLVVMILDEQPQLKGIFNL